jgi:hypothetical protein
LWGFRVITCINETDQIRVPAWVEDLASFRRWAASPDVPEKARISYRQGEVCLDIAAFQLRELGSGQSPGRLAGSRAL